MRRRGFVILLLSLLVVSAVVADTTGTTATDSTAFTSDASLESFITPSSDNNPSTPSITNPATTATIPATAVSTTDPTPTITSPTTTNNSTATAPSLEGNGNSPAYNSTYGSSPPPLQTPISWSNVIYGIVFVVVGLLEVFHGYKYIRITLFVVGWLFFSSTAVLILLLMDNSRSQAHSLGLYFLLWFCFGLIGSVISFFCWHLGLLLTAAYGGFTISVSILAIAHLQNYAIRWAIAFAVMIAFGLIVHFYERHVIILTTSLIGAYTFMYGIDEFARKGFRDMIEIAAIDGFFRFIPTLPIYIMTTIVFLLAAVGVLYEYKVHEEPIDHFWFGDGHRRVRDFSSATHSRASSQQNGDAMATDPEQLPISEKQGQTPNQTNDSSAKLPNKIQLFFSNIFGKSGRSSTESHQNHQTQNAHVIQMEEFD